MCTKRMRKNGNRLLKFAVQSVFLSVLLSVPAKVMANASGYDQKILNEIGVMLDELYDDGLIPNYVVDIRKDGRKIYFAARGTTELGGDAVSYTHLTLPTICSV